MITKNTIKELADQVTEQAHNLVSQAQGVPSEVIELYGVMADRCKEYYDGANIENYTARVSVYALSALGIVRSYGQPIAQNIKDKLSAYVNELADLTQKGLIETKNINRRVNEAELTDGQKIFIKETAAFITDLISVGVMITGVALPVILVLGTSVAAVVVGSVLAMPAITAATVSAPALAAAGIIALVATDMAVLGGAYAGLIGLVSAMMTIAPAIYSVHQDVCKFKEQNVNQNITQKELWNIIGKTDHIAQGQGLICSAINSVIESLTLRAEQILASGLKETIVAKEVTKSAVTNASHAVSNSKVGKGVKKAKDAVQRSAGKVKTKFTETVKKAREKVEQGIGSHARN